MISSAFHIGADPVLMGMIIRPDGVPRDTLNKLGFIPLIRCRHRFISWLIKLPLVMMAISLILTGIYLHNFSETVAAMGVKGIIISAMCVAFGMVLSLPTKMYLTFLLVMWESEKEK